MNEPILSVVVLVYNAEEYLNECLDSLVNQTLKEIEIIAIDDGSTDSSLEICETYQKQYDHFIVRTQPNAGGAVAGNNGIRLASGKYVALVDSDDFLPLDAYEVLVKNAEENQAQISIGRPLQYHNESFRQQPSDQERLVWRHKRTITAVSEFPDIFFDAFYWNKVFLRKFLIDDDILMPDGMLYADRPMVHKAYALASAISLTNHHVYCWRRDTKPLKISVSTDKYNLDNLRDRFESYTHTDDYLASNGHNEARVHSYRDAMMRICYPIDQINYNSEYREIYFSLVKEFLAKTDKHNYDGIPNRYRAICWLILNGHTFELARLLATNYRAGLKFQENKVLLDYEALRGLGVPEDVCEIDKPPRGFIKDFQLCEYRGSVFFQLWVNHSDKLLKPSSISLEFLDDNHYIASLKGLKITGNWFRFELSDKIFSQLPSKSKLALLWEYSEGSDVEVLLDRSNSNCQRRQSIKGMQLIAEDCENHIYLIKR